MRFRIDKHLYFNLQLARLLLPGTHITWGVNLKSYNLTAAYLETKAIIEAFALPQIQDAGIALEYVEIGDCHISLYENYG
jgi:hypothetical protein